MLLTEVTEVAKGKKVTSPGVVVAVMLVSALITDPRWEQYDFQTAVLKRGTASVGLLVLAGAIHSAGRQRQFICLFFVWMGG